MQPFTHHRGIVAPFDRANVDTDLIIPKQFLKSVKRTGFGPYLFDQLRYADEGQPGMDCSRRELQEGFFLNQPQYKDASILLARENFGCGSSREHAPWALLDFGFRVLIAPSFADIFYNNCFKNGLLPLTFADEIIDELFLQCKKVHGFSLAIDLEKQLLTASSDTSYTFTIDASRKQFLLAGLDDIGITLESADRIRAYEQKRKHECPWMFEDITVL